jgi:hypothetical protein
MTDIAGENAALADGLITVDQWQKSVAQQLLSYHYASYMAGRGTDTMERTTQASINEIVGAQIDYLNAFADQIDAEGWRDAFGARALMYAGAAKETYWRGKTFGLPLPYYPAQGTTCLTNCGCSWRIKWLDEEELDADCTWVRGKSDSCATCVKRERAGVVRIRGGERV